MNDGKTPYLADRVAPIVRAMTKAVGAAYRRCSGRPGKCRSMTPRAQVMKRRT